MIRPYLRIRFVKPALQWPKWKWLLALAALPFLYETGRVLFGDNLHEVIPGRVYRCNQPSSDSLPKLLSDYNIRTVVNLRGFCPAPKDTWYADEIRFNNSAGICQEDITLSANRLPPPDELRRVIDVLDRSDSPVIVHCKSGADRTGMVSTIALLLYSDASLDRARCHLLPRFGHFRFGRTASMDEFFDRYAAWLESRSEAHSPARFRDWAANYYSPGPARGVMTLVDHNPEKPIPAKIGEWLALKIQAKNTSHEPWVMKPGNHAGVHVQFQLFDPEANQIHFGQAGLMDRVVEPGGEIELTLAIPPVDRRGQFALNVNLIDATEASVPIRQNLFTQFGSDPLILLIDAK